MVSPPGFQRQQILRNLDAFVDEYKYRPNLLRFRKIHDLVELFSSINRLSSVKDQYKAVEGYVPAKASFISEDEITCLLDRGPNISESKLQIYAYFVQGHDENHSTKGIRFTRLDAESGYKGYDTQLR